MGGLPFPEEKGKRNGCRGRNRERRTGRKGGSRNGNRDIKLTNQLKRWGNNIKIFFTSTSIKKAKVIKIKEKEYPEFHRDSAGQVRARAGLGRSVPHGGNQQNIKEMLTSWEKKCPHMHHLFKPARRHTRSSTLMLLSTSQSSVQSAQRGRTPCLIKKRRNVKTWQKLTRLLMKGKWKPLSPPKKRPKRSSRIQALKRPPLAFLFCSEYHPKIKDKHSGWSIGDVAKQQQKPKTTKNKKLEEKWTALLQVKSSPMKRRCRWNAWQ